MKKLKANVPSRKKIKLNWFKAKADVSIERKVELQYNANSVLNNKNKWDVSVKYVLVKEGTPKEIPVNSPMTLYKEGLPFLFLSTSNSIGKKIISEELIDADIIVEDNIVEIKEGEPEISFEDALKPEEHIEIRTRYDIIARKITIENKLDNQVDLELTFKQTKDVSFIKSIPEANTVEEPNYQFNITVPSEQTKKISLELRAKIVTRVTKIKPEFVKAYKKR
ncbi:MAG: hypothetical protein BAJALOKI2v1_1180002 [Promethearchaeota archaeon]|nr:MAG: hypothetical protein BAJALOKI2v1_1180002 [Candidatus Lokiarchaeota archaeon]